jgi:hypothetical protein
MVAQARSQNPACRLLHDIPKRLFILYGPHGILSQKVINVWVPHNARNLLTSCSTISFTHVTLLRGYGWRVRAASSPWWQANTPTTISSERHSLLGPAFPFIRSISQSTRDWHCRLQATQGVSLRADIGFDTWLSSFTLRSSNE